MGLESFANLAEPAYVVRKEKISQIVSLRDHSQLSQYQLEPQLITNLFEEKREKRRLVGFAGLPKALVHALISAEDRRFFEHPGFDLYRIAKATWVDLKSGHKQQGASTLTMQLARSFWLRRLLL